MLGGDAMPPRMSRFAGDIDRHAHVVPLRQADLGRLHVAGVFEATELQRQQLRHGDAAGHVGQFELHGLIGGERAVEKNPVLKL